MIHEIRMAWFTALRYFLFINFSICIREEKINYVCNWPFGNRQERPTWCIGMYKKGGQKLPKAFSFSWIIPFGYLASNGCCLDFGFKARLKILSALAPQQIPLRYFCLPWIHHFFPVALILSKIGAKNPALISIKNVGRVIDMFFSKNEQLPARDLRMYAFYAFNDLRRKKSRSVLEIGVTVGSTFLRDSSASYFALLLSTLMEYSVNMGSLLVNRCMIGYKTAAQ